MESGGDAGFRGGDDEDEDGAGEVRRGPGANETPFVSLPAFVIRLFPLIFIYSPRKIRSYIFVLNLAMMEPDGPNPIRGRDGEGDCAFIHFPSQLTNEDPPALRSLAHSLGLPRSPGSRHGDPSSDSVSENLRNTKTPMPASPFPRCGFDAAAARQNSICGLFFRRRRGR